MPDKKSKVDKWLERETDHKRKALENASRHFDGDDSFTVNTLEGIYGVESSFGVNRRKRGMSGAAGDFQLEKETAKRMGLLTSKENDQRFDVDEASAASAKYLKILDTLFMKQKNLGSKLHTIPVMSRTERKKFTLAAYNAGEGRISKAQMLAKEDGKDPEKWDHVKEYLGAAGASPAKVKEIKNYVDSVLENANEFSEKSKASKRAKYLAPKKIKTKHGHWITKDGRRILIED